MTVVEVLESAVKSPFKKLTQHCRILLCLLVLRCYAWGTLICVRGGLCVRVFFFLCVRVCAFTMRAI